MTRTTNSPRTDTAGRCPPSLPPVEAHELTEWQTFLIQSAKDAETERQRQIEAYTIIDRYRASEGADDMRSAQEPLNAMTLRDDVRPVKFKLGFAALVVLGICAFGYALAAPAPEWVGPTDPICMKLRC